MRNFNLDFLTNFSYVGYCTLLYIGSVKEVIQSVLNYGDYNINLNLHKLNRIWIILRGKT